MPAAYLMIWRAMFNIDDGGNMLAGGSDCRLMSI